MITLLLIMSSVIYHPTEMVEREATGFVQGVKATFTIEKIPFLDRRGDRLWVRSGGVKEALGDMIELANSHGYEIKLNSAYRTFSQQQTLYNLMPDIAARPGYGGMRTHQTGCAIDISGVIVVVDGKKRKTILYWWLKRFAKKFGFKETVVGEPWHWTYIGPLKGELREVGGE